MLDDLLGGEEQGYRNVTFTDAVVNCQNTSRDRFGKRIRNLVVDNHSSRYDIKRNLYKIFLKLDLYNKRDSDVTLHYVNCFVKASNGKLNKFDVMEDKETPTSPTNDGTNLFGWPIKK